MRGGCNMKTEKATKDDKKKLTIRNTKEATALEDKVAELEKKVDLLFKIIRKKGW